MDQQLRIGASRSPWNKGKIVGQKAPLKLKDIWAIRIRLQVGERARELALFNLAVDSKLRSCDLVKPRCRRIRDAYAAPHKGVADLPSHEEPSSRSTATRP